MLTELEAMAARPPSENFNRQFSEVLYTTHSNGQIGSWEIEVFDMHPVKTVVTATKVIGGKPVVTEGFTEEGKNIGRANETTPLEQAIAEAKSKVNKKLDKGYTHQMPDRGGKATNALGFMRPMLAQPIEKVKGWEFPAAGQPKMDGHRMLATEQDGQVVLYSRQGKVVSVEHIRLALQEALDAGYWDGTPLDGEVYAHGETLQRISSWVKKPKPESEKLVYNLYDMMRDVDYSLRLNNIRQLCRNITSEKVQVTETITLFSEQDLDDLHAKYIGMGYEGTIVRQGRFGYEDGKRSKSLMKKKDFQDAEFEIVGVEEGKPNLRLGKRVGIYRCVTKDGKEFTVTSPGDATEKHSHAENGVTNIGLMLTVKFFNYTPDGVPFHPVALRVREDI